MLKALRLVQKVKKSTLSGKWEPLLNNLGHTSRKLGKFEDALGYHQQALVLQPLSASTFSSIGFVQTLMGKYYDAVESFHKALGLRREDAFSTTMLNNVVEHLVSDMTPFDDIPEDTPKIEDLGTKMARVKSRGPVRRVRMAQIADDTDEVCEDEEEDVQDESKQSLDFDTSGDVEMTDL